MNIHLKFILLFLFMGVVTFVSCLQGGGDAQTYTIADASFMKYGSIYTFPALLAVSVSGACLVLYGLSMWWGTLAYRLVVDARRAWDERNEPDVDDDETDDE